MAVKPKKPKPPTPKYRGDPMPEYEGDKKAKTRVVTPDLAHQVKRLNKGRKSRV